MLLLNQFFRILNKYKAPILNIREILVQAAVFKIDQDGDDDKITK